MVQRVDTEWVLKAASPIDRGFSRLYHVVVENDDGMQECVLKIRPPEEMAAISAEARLLVMLSELTNIPVPAVVGVVDEHDEFPTPFFMMEYINGTASDFEETRNLSPPVHETIAVQTGEYLAELHSVDTVDTFGRIWWDGSDPCDGGRPSDASQQLETIERYDEWSEFLRATTMADLDKLRTTEFSDLAPLLREWMADRIYDLKGPISPVVARIDHGIHNLLIEPHSGDIRALLDWGFTLAASPGYDLHVIEWVLSGAVLSSIPGTPDRQEFVREGLLEGYRRLKSYDPEPGSEDETLYETMAIVRSMHHLDAGVVKIPEGSRDIVAAGLRDQLQEVLSSNLRGS